MDGWTNLFFQKFCTLLQCYSKWLVKYAFIHCSTGVQNNCKKTLVKCRKTQNFYKLIAKVQRNFPQCTMDILSLRHIGQQTLSILNTLSLWHFVIMILIWDTYRLSMYLYFGLTILTNRVLWLESRLTFQPTRP